MGWPLSGKLMLKMTFPKINVIILKKRKMTGFNKNKDIKFEFFMAFYEF